ncbi:MAG: hypothetical protein HC838_13160 [Spirulinaceae cyanobacterium RM2_2_10]|nr:hypothetical protein [Spirulinaceae cyanobacterium SM2_1_0]NJO20793.1 hypothetical protein [Spirulinaceae cyanobacterium RM2_2_10]
MADWSFHQLPHLGDASLLVSTWLAQTVTDPDVLGQMQRWFQNFVSSGQLAALIIGFVLGFAFRGLTAG